MFVEMEIGRTQDQHTENKWLLSTWIGGRENGKTAGIISLSSLPALTKSDSIASTFQSIERKISNPLVSRFTERWVSKPKVLSQSNRQGLHGSKIRHNSHTGTLKQQNTKQPQTNREHKQREQNLCSKNTRLWCYQGISERQSVNEWVNRVVFTVPTVTDPPPRVGSWRPKKRKRVDGGVFRRRVSSRARKTNPFPGKGGRGSGEGSHPESLGIHRFQRIHNVLSFQSVQNILRVLRVLQVRLMFLSIQQDSWSLRQDSSYPYIRGVHFHYKLVIRIGHLQDGSRGKAGLQGLEGLISSRGPESCFPLIHLPDAYRVVRLFADQAWWKQ